MSKQTRSYKMTINENSKEAVTGDAALMKKKLKKYRFNVSDASLYRMSKGDTRLYVTINSNRILIQCLK